VYKLDSGNGGGAKKGKKGRGEEVVTMNGNGVRSGLDERVEMESVILGAMALKCT